VSCGSCITVLNSKVERAERSSYNLAALSFLLLMGFSFDKKRTNNIYAGYGVG